MAQHFWSGRAQVLKKSVTRMEVVRSGSLPFLMCLSTAHRASKSVFITHLYAHKLHVKKKKKKVQSFLKHGCKAHANVFWTL